MGFLILLHFLFQLPHFLLLARKLSCHLSLLLSITLILLLTFTQHFPHSLLIFLGYSIQCLLDIVKFQIELIQCLLMVISLVLECLLQCSIVRLHYL